MRSQICCRLCHVGYSVENNVRLDLSSLVCVHCNVCRLLLALLLGLNRRFDAALRRPDSNTANGAKCHPLYLLSLVIQIQRLHYLFLNVASVTGHSSPK